MLDGGAIIWGSDPAESPQVSLLTWGDLISALNHPLLIFLSLAGKAE